jgi:citrate lyase beta subunit
MTILLGAAAGRLAAEYPIDGLVFPKVRHVHEVEWLDGVLSDIEKEAGLQADQIRVCFQIETGWGVLNLPELATAGLGRLAGIILGTVDLSADLLLPEARFRHPIAEWARMMIVTVAGACGVPAIDGMTLDFPVGRAELDAEQNRALILDRMLSNFQDALHSIDVGMAGRWVGHPLQLLATMLAYRFAFAESSIEEHVATLEEFARALSMHQGAVAGSSGQLLDVGTDRHVRQMLRRATAWGLLTPARAHQLGLISDLEVKAI